MSARFLPAKITNIKKLTEKASEITLFTINQLPYKAGQYINLKVFISGEPQIRSYSICSAQHEGSEIKIGVKAIEKGVVSNYLVYKAKVDDVIEIEEPMGNFILPENNMQPLFLIAGGSGITPLFSIIKTQLKNGNEHITLIYANSNENEVMFKNEINELVAQYPVRFTKIDALSMGSTQNNIGRITKENLAQAIKLNKKENSLFMLCGPNSLMDIATEILINNSVEPKYILRESFTSTINKEALSSASFSGEADMEVVLDGRKFKVKAQKGKTILESALDGGLDAPYSCMGGVCTSCKAKLVSGEIKMDDDALGLTDREVADGYILTCSSVIKSEGVCVSYDV